MPSITEVVKHLIIINVIMFIIPTLIWGYYGRGVLALHFPLSEGFMPFQFVTSIFMHGDPLHLLFNMYMLYFLGVLLETYWGAKKFLKYYLICGVGASIIALAVNFATYYYSGEIPLPSLGASGAIFGLLMAAFLSFPEKEVSLIFPPITLKFKVLVPILMGLELYLGLNFQNTGIGHFAHLGGALVGFILIRYWDKNDMSNRWN